MTKKKAALWIMAFFIIIASPPFTHFFMGKYVDTENYENRSIAAKPKLTIENYDTFSEEYEEYYNENIPYRNQLITLNNYIDYFLFDQSSNRKVIIGKDGWLFYCNDDDFNALEQSLGYWKYSDEQLKMIEENLKTTKTVLESQGIEFVLFIAPNKETVYLDELPDYYKAVDANTSTDQLINYLKNNVDIRIVYPRDKMEEIMNTHTDVLLYQKLDTHWNHAGAYVGAASLIEELGGKMPSLEEVCLEPVYSSVGDLANMLNITIKNGNLDYNISDSKVKTAECLKGDFNTEFVFYMPAGDTRRLFVRRDSFSSLMMPFVASEFENSLFMHYMSFSQRQIFDYDADIFVLETAERYLPSLENFRVSFIDFSVLEEGDNKIIAISPALVPEKPQYVSVSIRQENAEGRVQYSELEYFDREIKIQVPIAENGEVYVTVFSNKTGNDVLEERVISY